MNTIENTRPTIRTEYDPDPERDHRLCLVVRDGDEEFRLKVECWRTKRGDPYVLLDPTDDDLRLEGDTPGAYHLVRVA